MEPDAVEILSGVYEGRTTGTPIALLIRKMPVSIINLPNKDYWLAPERREASFDYLSGWMFWFGSATMIFLVTVMQEAILYNLGRTQKLEGPWIMLMVFLALTTAMVIHMFLRFRKPKSLTG